MQYQILVEHPNQNGFVASVIGVPDCVVTANTEEEAIASVRQALQARLSQAKIVAIEVESLSEENPLLKYAGHLKDDPYFDEMMDEVKKYRREADAQDQPVTGQLENANGKKLTGNPWIDSFGVLKDDPTFDDLMEKLERYRREGNSEIA